MRASRVGSGSKVAATRAHPLALGAFALGACLALGVSVRFSASNRASEQDLPESEPEPRTSGLHGRQETVGSRSHEHEHRGGRGLFERLEQRILGRDDQRVCFVDDDHAPGALERTVGRALEHIPDVAHALFEVRRVLKPGGRLLVTVPWNPPVLRPPDPLGQHVRFFTRRSLTRALDVAGFAPVEVRRARRMLVARASRPGRPGSATRRPRR